MYYKVLKDNKVIDVLDHLLFVKYQHKHGIMVNCDESEAQAIISSDGNYIWHVIGLYAIPVDEYDTVELVEVDEYEYKRLKVLNMQTPEQIIDEFVSMMIDGFTDNFIESLCRMYVAKTIDDKKLNELLVSKKINQQEYSRIVSAKEVS